MRFSFSFEVSRNRKPVDNSMKVTDLDWNVPPYLQDEPKKSTTKRKVASPGFQKAMKKAQADYKIPKLSERSKRILKTK